MLHKAWNSKGEMPYCFPRSSIKFQGHTVQNITDFDPNWAFPDYRPVAAFKSLRFALFNVICQISRSHGLEKKNSLVIVDNHNVGKSVDMKILAHVKEVIVYQTTNLDHECFMMVTKIHFANCLESNYRLSSLVLIISFLFRCKSVIMGMVIGDAQTLLMN